MGRRTDNRVVADALIAAIVMCFFALGSLIDGNIALGVLLLFLGMGACSGAIGEMKR